MEYLIIALAFFAIDALVILGAFAIHSQAKVDASTVKLNEAVARSLDK